MGRVRVCVWLLLVLYPCVYTNSTTRECIRTKPIGFGIRYTFAVPFRWAQSISHIPLICAFLRNGKCLSALEIRCRAKQWWFSPAEALNAERIKVDLRIADRGEFLITKGILGYGCVSLWLRWFCHNSPRRRVLEEIAMRSLTVAQQLVFFFFFFFFHYGNAASGIMLCEKCLSGYVGIINSLALMC